jgi:Asp-tRNA(Asn)/Glu-tRNA(Gln) amidotransferase A subunit family amidase
MQSSDLVSRRDFVVRGLAAAVAASLPLGAWAQGAPEGPGSKLTVADLEAAERVLGITLTPAQRKRLLPSVVASLAAVQVQRKAALSPFTFPPTPFQPLRTGDDRREDAGEARPHARPLAAREELILSAPLPQIAHWLRARVLTSVQLTEMSLARMARLDSRLKAVVTVTAERALAAARRADRMFANGEVVSLLQGVPYGLKDLFATSDAPTTWGAAPYRRQRFEFDATVVQRLDAAGAVLVAKTSVGALALGDQWYGGQTLNPWNLKRGSSGSSAGSASGVAAAYFPFAIGTETLGSIASPSVECRVVGLRPSFGRVSRAGAMSLSPTMDKVGVLSQHTVTCREVFRVIHGADPLDAATVTRPFRSRKALRRIGYVADAKPTPRHAEVVEYLRRSGFEVVPYAPPTAPDALEAILMVESAAFHDDLVQSGRIDDIKKSPWPDYFRSARFTSGVDYFNAMRHRAELMRTFEASFAQFDALLTPGIGLETLFLTNLTGHPQVIVPDGPSEADLSQSWSVIGHLDAEYDLLALGDRLAKFLIPNPTQPEL